ncbi:hypothetical protein Hanom_Chr05g00436781 [Helianthus anomalus]
MYDCDFDSDICCNPKQQQQQQQYQPYPVNATNNIATYRVWEGWDVDGPCLYP